MEKLFELNRQTILQSRYFYLLISLLGFFIVNPFLGQSRFSNFILLIFFGFIFVFSIYSISNKKLLIIFTLIFAVISYATYWYIMWINSSQFIYVVHFIFNILFMSVITLSVIGEIAKHHAITKDTLFGAICGYLLLGFTWSFIYLLIASIDPDSFSIHMEHEVTRLRIDHFIYYSFETLTTLGYGDILALKPVARTFSWLEAVFGQVYLAVWISQLVGLRILQMKKS